jgi:hypothetical protein
MSIADKDGRILQAVQDMHTLLGMELHERVRELRSELDALLPEECP